MDSTLAGEIVAVLLTVMVFSYLIGANPLWRIAQSLLVGVSVGYVTLVVLTQVVAPQVARVIQPPAEATAGDTLLAAVPVVFGLLLLLRIAFPGAWPASFALTLVVVVGASLALGGALAGALVPQVLDTLRSVDFNRLDATGIATIAGNIVLVLGVVCALAYFAFGARANGRRPSPVREMSWVGRWVLVLAFGAVLGSLATTFYFALIDRLWFLISTVENWIGI
jgi:hypothetical protein